MSIRISQAGTTWRQRGAALIIVLAFVVLLTGLVVAYFSRTTTDKQISTASLNNTAADVLARSALNIVTSDIKNEVTTDINNGTPTSANIGPVRDSDVSAAPNLIRRSLRSNGASFASAINSTTDASANNRLISSKRWNSHFLLPSTVSNSLMPDWVLVTRNGPKVETSVTTVNNPAPSNADYVVGRYAYAVYDEGGLLDVNVAGYPSPAPTPTTWTTDIGRKGVLAFADLTTLPNATGYLTTPAINRVVLFRNYATAYDAGNGLTLNSTSFTTAAGTLFTTYYLNTNKDFGIVNPTKVGAVAAAYRTDQAFTSRSELIKFQQDVYTSAGVTTFTPDILQYLGTFSRSQNQPTFPRAKGSTTPFPSRFDVSKLSNIASFGDFGLKNVGGQWQYWGAGGSVMASAIPKIQTDTSTGKVCAPGSSTCTPPDFFQILNYALHPDWQFTTSTDSNNIATTLAVGATIIDQYDTDSATIRIDYSGGTVYGMEKNDTARPQFAPNPPASYVMLQTSTGSFNGRPFRNVGDFGYAFRQGSSRPDATLDLSSTTSPDAGVLDFFTYSTATTRSGIVNLNTRQPGVLAAIIKSAIYNELLSQAVTSTSDATNAASAIVTESIATAATSRADTARFASKVTNSPFNSATSDESRETIDRALAEIGQTRTWGLLIDVVAQTGHYSPSSSDLTKFIVDGEKRYWLHYAIDRFDGTVLGQQLEEVFDQ